MEALSKYFMPQSVTWWAGVASLLSGIIILLEVPTVSPILTALWNGSPPAALISGGLAAIGLRKAQADAAAQAAIILHQSQANGRK